MSAQAPVPSPEETPKPRGYLPELDGLRAVAFLMVFVSHALPNEASVWGRRLGPGMSSFLASCVGGGRYGVCVFFALSGYLITTLLLRERERFGSVDLKAFWGRRILRIWPLYYFALALVAVLDVCFESTDHLRVVEWCALLGFGSNWSIFILGWPFSALTHLWSVALEEQFYLAWPFALRAWGRRQLLVGILVVLVVNAVGRTTAAALLHGDHAELVRRLIWVTPFGQLDALGAGCLLALWNKPLPISPRLAQITAALGVAALFMLGRFDHALVEPIPGLLVVTAIAVAAGLVVASTLRAGASSWLGSRPLVALGRISYGLYVYHLIVLVRLNLTWRSMFAPPIVLVITLALAAASYRWLERPFLNLKRHFTHKNGA